MRLEKVLRLENIGKGEQVSTTYLADDLCISGINSVYESKYLSRAFEGIAASLVS